MDICPVYICRGFRSLSVIGVATDYGQYLSAAQWRSHFAPTDATAKTVSDWLASQGFTVTGPPANHRFRRDRDVLTAAALPPPPGGFRNFGPCSTYYGQKPPSTCPRSCPTR